jgi:hypothetical protein
MALVANNIHAPLPIAAIAAGTGSVVPSRKRSRSTSSSSGAAGVLALPPPPKPPRVLIGGAWCMSEVTGMGPGDAILDALGRATGLLHRFHTLIFEPKKSAALNGSRLYTHLDRAADPYVAELLEWAAAPRDPAASITALPDWPSPRDDRPRPADAAAFLGDLAALPEFTAPHWAEVRREVEGVMGSPGFFAAAARTPYADAVPDEVVRQFRRRYAACKGLDLPTLTKIFGWFPIRHYNDMVRMIAGRAMVHRGVASVDWNNTTTKTLRMEHAASYRIAGHLVSQMAAQWTHGRATVPKKNPT